MGAGAEQLHAAVPDDLAGRARSVLRRTSIACAVLSQTPLTTSTVFHSNSLCTQGFSPISAITESSFVAQVAGLRIDQRELPLDADGWPGEPAKSIWATCPAGRALAGTNDTARHPLAGVTGGHRGLVGARRPIGLVVAIRRDVAEVVGSGVNDDRSPRTGKQLVFGERIGRRHQQCRAPIYSTLLKIKPADPKQKPAQAVVPAVSADFFAMFQAPFKFGGPWTQADDEDGNPIVVTPRKLDDQFFGGTNSVGRTLVLDGTSYRVLGVWIDGRWCRGSTTFVSARTAKLTMFIPFNRAIKMQAQVISGTSCNSSIDAGFESRLRSECLWTQLWVDCPTAADVARYRCTL